MPSDFHNLQDAGQQCAGCGRTADQAFLMRIPSYSRAYACAMCSVKYAACANLSPIGAKCNHGPHVKKPCPLCGCPEYLHSLVDEINRQFAACVGLEPTSRECTGYGSVECHRIVFAGADGVIPRLCESCMRGWVNDTKEGAKQAGALLDIKTDTELPT